MAVTKIKRSVAGIPLVGRTAFMQGWVRRAPRGLDKEGRKRWYRSWDRQAKKWFDDHVRGKVI